MYIVIAFLWISDDLMAEVVQSLMNMCPQNALSFLCSCRVKLQDSLWTRVKLTWNRLGEGGLFRFTFFVCFTSNYNLWKWDHHAPLWYISNDLTVKIIYSHILLITASLQQDANWQSVSQPTEEVFLANTAAAVALYICFIAYNLSSACYPY